MGKAFLIVFNPFWEDRMSKSLEVRIKGFELKLLELNKSPELFVSFDMHV